jgi:hypothetical protein
MPYVKVMEEIKRRTFVINACLEDKTDITGPARIELAALQLRMTLELIALGSLAANKELFEMQSMRFEKHWHPSQIIKDLEKLNPNFYPIPFKAKDRDDNGIIKHDAATGEYLTKEELVRVHGICGNVLHARNPFGKPIDHDRFAMDISDWIGKVIRLLNCHEIKLVGDDHIYVVNMTEHGRDAVFMYELEMVAPNKSFKPNSLRGSA